MRRKPIKNEYDNYRFYNWCRYSDSPEMVKLVRELCDEIRYKNKLALKNMNSLLSDLYLNSICDTSRYLGYSRDKNSYINNRYNPLEAGYDPTVKVVDRLSVLGYLETIKGFNDRRTGHSECAKLIPKEKLLCAFKKANIQVYMIKTAENEEIIILKDENKKRYAYEETDATQEMRNKLKAYNDLIEKTHIQVNVNGYSYIRKKQTDEKRRHVITVDYTNKKTKRIFNNRTFDNGGRFYGGFWQGIPSDLRGRILINGDNVAELDYSGIHVHLLYAICGIELKDKEPYLISKSNDTNNLRNIYKLLLITSINCKSDDSCIYVVEKEISEDMLHNPTKYQKEIPDLRTMLNKLKEHHKPIANFINSGEGIRLMVVDSNIAEDILYEMTLKNIPVLGIHDGFICRVQDVEVLRNQMINSYVKIVSEELAKRNINLQLNKEHVKLTIDASYSQSRLPFKNWKNPLDLVTGCYVLKTEAAIRHLRFIRNDTFITETQFIEATEEFSNTNKKIYLDNVLRQSWKIANRYFKFLYKNT